MRALIITWENFQDQELVYPYYRLKEETDDVVVMSNVVGKFFGIMGSILMTDVINSSIYDFHCHPAPKGSTGAPYIPFFGV